MNRLTKFLIGGALAVMSVLGIVALNLSPDVALAQTPTATPAPGQPGGPGGRGAGPGRGFGHLGGADVDTAIAQALGITAEQLRTELQAGKTLAQLAQEKGVSQDAVKQAIGNAKKAAVDAAVAAGRLTAEQATQMKARIDTEIAALDLSQSRVGGLKPDKGLGRGFRGAPGQVNPNPNATPNSTVPNFRGRPAPAAPSGSSL